MGLDGSEARMEVERGNVLSPRIWALCSEGVTCTQRNSGSTVLLRVDRAHGLEDVILGRVKE